MECLFRLWFYTFLFICGELKLFNLNFICIIAFLNISFVLIFYGAVSFRLYINIKFFEFIF